MSKQLQEEKCICGDGFEFHLLCPVHSADAKTPVADVNAVNAAPQKARQGDSLRITALNALDALSGFYHAHNDPRRYDTNKAWHLIYNL